MSRGILTNGKRSRFEAKVGEALGAAWDYEGESLAYVLENNYWPDYTHKKSKIIVEAKGRFTGADRRKMLKVKATHPGRDIRLVFMRNNTLNKGSKTTYMDWARKHGFRATVFPDLPLDHREVTASAKKRAATKTVRR